MRDAIEKYGGEGELSSLLIIYPIADHLCELEIVLAPALMHRVDLWIATQGIQRI